VDQDEEEELVQEVTLGELEDTLKCFSKDKSPGPDGWSIEFYLAFFELIGPDLLSMVEESRVSGWMEVTISSTFIALILKVDNPSTFADFCPISLCNCLYKIIAKIIANRLKPILSMHIVPEQFVFLKDRQIHEAIGTAQEVLHSLHSRKDKGMIMKVDLSKAFDRVN